MIYVIQVWGSAGKTEIHNILVLQKRAIRLISNKDKRPVNPGPLAATNPMFYKLEILKINDIFTHHIIKFIHKCFNLDSPEIVRDWFKLNYEFIHTVLNLLTLGILPNLTIYLYRVPGLVSMG